MSPKRIAKPLDIYVRVSDVKGRSGESFISPEEQEDRCRAAIAAKGARIGQVFTDLDKSGKTMERPELDKARERIKAGVSGGIVVAKIDRFGRTVARALDAIAEIDEAGGVVITAEGDFDTSTAVGELVLSMMLTLAQFELRRIRENWTAAQTRAVARGVHVSANVPAGYERGGDGRLKPNTKDGPTLGEAYRMAAVGRPPAEIARFLNERKFAKGTFWKSSRIKRLLANRVYLGEARYGEITNPDAHEPLTDSTTWLLAQRDSKAAPISEDSPYVLAGLVRCASCRHAMRPQKARGKTIATYRCATETASGRCPHPTSISMSRLDEFVLTQFTLRAFYEPAEPRTDHDDSAARATLAEAQRELDEVKTLEGELRPAVYAQALDTALDNLEAAQAKLSEAASFDDHDAARIVNAALPLLSAASLVAGEYDLDELGRKTVRAALGRDVQAVFVRPAASRSKTLPIEDRVRIVWCDEDALELPHRGERFEPRAYVWN